jgi:hypothetical protein
MTIPELWALFYQRDSVLIALFLAPLTGLGMYAAHQWHQHERFLSEHPEIGRTFAAWRKRHRPNPRECPTHHIIVLPRKSCPACGWKPPRK